MKAHVIVSFVSAALFFLASCGARAAEAVFSADGGKVYCCNYEPGQLGLVDLSAKTYKVIHLKEGMKSLTVNGLSRSNSGNILMITDHAVWAWDPAKDKIVKVADVDKKYTLDDLAYNPHTEDILITADESAGKDRPTAGVALIINKGKSKAAPVFTRRVDRMRGLAFDKEGDLFFGTDGDLWAGEISPPNEAWAGILTAYRHAPFATRETAEHNGIGEGVYDVAVSGEWLYIGIGNRYGGNLVRMPKPKLKRAPEEGLDTQQELKTRWALMAKALADAVIVGKPDSVSRSGLLCASADGNRIVFQITDDTGRAFMLIEGGGAPTEIARPPSQ